MMPSSTPLPELSQVVDWLGLGFRVPEDWEIVRHGIGFERGSLVFVDRVRQRLSVSWTACPRVPDLDRLLSDFESQPSTAGETVLTQNDRFGFRVLECETSAGARVTHALHFDSASSRLIELELPGSSAQEGQALSQALLAGFAFSPRAESRTVRAFGVHATLPLGFLLCRSQVKPADVSLEFERVNAPGEHSPTRLKIRRSGMARVWFDGDAARAIRTRNPKLQLRDCENRRVGSHVATVARGFPRGALLPRALGRAAEHEIMLWECPEQNAVFEIERRELRRIEPDAASLRVWCCAGSLQEVGK